MKDIGRMDLVEKGVHGMPWLKVQWLVGMNKVWGDFLTPVVPMAEKEVMDLGEGIIMVDQMVGALDVAKMKIIDLDPLTEMVMAEVKAYLL